MSIALNNHVQKLIEEIQNNVYTPTRFIAHIIENNGDAYTTIKGMLTPPSKVQEGFVKLAQAKRLDLSIEALVLYSDFADEFAEDVKAEATKRLRGADPKKAWK